MTELPITLGFPAWVPTAQQDHWLLHPAQIHPLVPHFPLAMASFSFTGRCKANQQQMNENLLSSEDRPPVPELKFTQHKFFYSSKIFGYHPILSGYSGTSGTISNLCKSSRRFWSISQCEFFLEFPFQHPNAFKLIFSK